MLELLLPPLSGWFQPFNLFGYLTVRAGGALMTAFLLGTIMGPWLIEKFKIIQHGGETVRAFLPHQKKAGTPTMGGVLIVVAWLVASLLWNDLSNAYVWLILGTGMTFATVGILDDYLALKKLWRHGLPGWLRLVVQFGVAILTVGFALSINPSPEATYLYLPFFKEFVIDLGLFGFAIFGAFVLVGSANAVNLTDGLDGLVSIPAVIVAATLAVLAYVVGRADFTEYLHIAYVPGAGEIAVSCAGLAGAVLAFLWYNAPPARIFMGDTGSLTIGSVLGTVAVLIKQEFALAIIGGLFVLETISVIVQVVSFKLTGKRVFKMAPLHHHFEQLGWPESTIVVRFWIIALLLALIGLATLKLR
jgi:phospho-N-acetylmuramoyl-pentapeptide-transferase